MIGAEFFSRLGFFVIPQFFNNEMCNQLRCSFASAEWKPATVTDGSNDANLEKYRKSRQYAIDTGMKKEVLSRLSAIMPQLESHFKITLSECQPPNFLSYSIGDFFRRHEDAGDHPDLTQAVRRRKVSAVVFLNRNAEEGLETYSGGALTFYGIFPDDPQLKSRGFPLRPEEGLLVAFSSRMTHEVQPVTRGRRYSIVTFYS